MARTSDGFRTQADRDAAVPDPRDAEIVRLRLANAELLTALEEATPLVGVWAERIGDDDEIYLWLRRVLAAHAPAPPESDQQEQE